MSVTITFTLSPLCDEKKLAMKTKKWEINLTLSVRENFKTIKINKFTLKYPKAFFHNVNGTLKAGIVGSGRTVNTALPTKAENIRLKSLNAFAV